MAQLKNFLCDEASNKLYHYKIVNRLSTLCSRLNLQLLCNGLYVQCSVIYFQHMHTVSL